MGSDLTLGSHRPVRAIDVCAVLAFAMPDRGDAESDWPVGGILEDGSVAIVAHLVAVVFEGLAKRAQLRPRFVARRARHSIFSCEGR